MGRLSPAGEEGRNDVIPVPVEVVPSPVVIPSGTGSDAQQYDGSGCG